MSSSLCIMSYVSSLMYHVFKIKDLRKNLITCNVKACAVQLITNLIALRRTRK